MYKRYINSIIIIIKNCDWSNLTQDHFSWNENLQQKQNWIATSTNVEDNTWKIEAVFVIRAALWAEKLRPCLE